MFALFHFGFELVKIAALSAIYASLLYLLLRLSPKERPLSRFRWIRFKSLFLSIGGLLLIFLFTYWGNHGLGDEANIRWGTSKQWKAATDMLTLAPQNRLTKYR